jgi:ATP-dependent helicase/nuclease subunit A
MHWTKQQSKAISTTGTLCVSASAGTGKTAVLTERVVQQVLHGTDILNILVLTFSENAAKEVKARVQSRFFEMLKDDSLSLQKKNVIQYQLSKFQCAHFNTFHGFCLELIRSNHFFLGLPDKLHTDPNRNLILLQQSIKNVIGNAAQKNNASLDNLYLLLKGKDSFEDVLEKLYLKVREHKDWKNWLKDRLEYFYSKPITEIPKIIQEVILDDLSKAMQYLTTAQQSLSASEFDTSKADDLLSSEISMLDTDKQEIKNGNIHFNGSQINFSGRLSTPKDTPIVKELRDKAKKTLQIYKNFELNTVLQNLHTIQPLANNIYHLLLEIDSTYFQAKQREKLIDYADMEILALHLLQKTNGFVVRNFAHVFIDEYQDTSPIQDAILSFFYNADMFYVGDVKQSIYAFRSADPHLFYDKLQKSKTVVTLNDNFRSGQNILNCTNDVFQYASQISKTNIPYTKDDQLQHTRDDCDVMEPVKISLIQPLENMTNEIAQIAQICGVIRTIKIELGKSIYDPNIKRKRPIMFKDFAVLNRKLYGRSHLYEQLFYANEIPFKMEQTSNILDSIETDIVTALSGFVVYPDNDFYVVTLMHEGLFGFTDADILQLKEQGRPSLFKDMLSITDEQKPIFHKISLLLSLFHKAKEKESTDTVVQLLQFLIDKSGFRDICAMNSSQGIQNIKTLIMLGKDQPTLYSYIRYIDLMKKANVTISNPQPNNDSSDAVTITTIHRSKGLEYPIVILPFLDAEYDSLDAKNELIYNTRDGIAINNLVDGTRCKNFLTYAFGKKAQKTAREEELRLLYVALTRATEKLFIQGIDNSNPFGNLNNSLSIILAATAADSSTGLWKKEKIYEGDLKPFIQEYNPIPKEEFFNKFPIPQVEEISNKIQYIPAAITATETDISEISPKKILGEDTPAAHTGTATHAFLQYLQFSNECCNVTFLKKELNRMISHSMLTSTDAQVINLQGIAQFFQSELGQKILSSKNISKECELQYVDEHGTIVHCVLDLLVFDDEQDIYYIIDYKTDKWDIKQEKQKIENHKKQLVFYTKAVQQLYPGKKITAVLVMLNYPQEIYFLEYL